jgi:mono/diheme cytochrome c family protein
MRTLLPALALGASLLVAAPGLVSAQAAGPPAASFTTAQADNGKLVYEQNCASCHSADLSGGEGPPLTGAPFLYTWGGQQVVGLLKFVQNNMPASAPGTLTPEAALNVLSYVLSQNKIKAGDSPLTATTNAIVLVPPGDKR